MKTKPTEELTETVEITEEVDEEVEIQNEASSLPLCVGSHIT